MPMLEYLKKFNSLPAEIREKISSGQSLAIIETLEKKYQIALAALIMKAAVKEIALADLESYFIKEKLTPDAAGELAKELKTKIFSLLGNYLNDIKVKGASFFFSADDEAEIRELAKKIDKVERGEMTADMIEKKLDLIIERAQINFGSADLADRFRQILKTYLRGIRNRLETKATLAKPFLSGGLSFDNDSAEQAMTLTDKTINSSPDQPVKPLPKIKLPEDLAAKVASARPPIIRDAPYDFSKMKSVNDQISADLTKLDTSHELTPPPSPSPKLADKVNLKNQEKKISPAAVSQDQSSVPALASNVNPLRPPRLGEAGSEASQMPLIRRRFEAENLNQSARRKIEDVKYVPKVMEPLDEIKYLDLVNFRRLDRDPSKAAEKIKSKINLLEEESYGKRLEGVKFWRLSPINKLYLEIGHLSISANKPVDVIIEERKAGGEDYLTNQEFEAIMDLNKSLRF